MNVLAVGSVAAELLEHSRTALVQGSTRQGVFLRLDHGWIIFLSREVERGPLTLNIADEAGNLDSLAIGSQYELTSLAEQAARSDNVENSLLLDTSQAQVWSAPPRPSDFLPAVERAQAVASTIRHAQRIRLTASLAALQAVQDGAIHAPEGPAGQFFPHLTKIIDLVTGRQRSTGAAIASPLRRLDTHSFYALFGLGSGLTPTGDDILLGMLLALNRWRSVVASRLDIAAVNRDILVQAYQRTTTISANLIECAVRGQADERLITALDGMMTGALEPAEAANLLASWGSSSGLDALCGMALVI
jgi:hypothetical protein